MYEIIAQNTCKINKKEPFAKAITVLIILLHLKKIFENAKSIACCVRVYVF